MKCSILNLDPTILTLSTAESYDLTATMFCFVRWDWKKNYCRMFYHVSLLQIFRHNHHNFRRKKIPFFFFLRTNSFHNWCVRLHKTWHHAEPFILFMLKRLKHNGWLASAKRPNTNDGMTISEGRRSRSFFSPYKFLSQLICTVT